ncbi:TniQ family protein [Sagittula salina]|uniref:TniQ family protein n=1 Tax=Sagittula salina TaxID=2820268 RepID=A0A940S204_9RHOB|nr:TniQ family protein [Sagittula salina]MBP0483621.1 TniQ family protein [Sagittula salina]
MPQRLPLTVTPRSRETLPSFFARLAAVNGTEPMSFAMDMGFSLKRVIVQDADSLAHVRELSGMSLADLAELLSWTGERLGDVRMKFRGDTFVSRALRSPTMRGCPACLAKDAEAPGEPLGNIVMRGDWLCRGVDVCVNHRLELVPLWTEANPTKRENLGARLSALLPRLSALRSTAKEVEVSGYDRWLDGRLAGHEDDSWLRDHSVFAAMTLCDALGEDLRRHQGLEPDKRAARAAGFEVASRGPESIRSALDALHREKDGGLVITKSRLKSIFDALDIKYGDDPEFDRLRAVVRTYLLEFWPTAANEIVLGSETGARLRHTIASAAEETGIWTEVLDDIFTAEGAFDSETEQQTHPKTIALERWGALLSELPQLVRTHDFRTALGATDTEFAILQEEGVIAPHIKATKVRRRWRLADALDLRDRLLDGAAPQLGPLENWETPLAAKNLYGLSLRTLIDAISDGLLPRSLHPDRSGVHALLLHRADIKAFLASMPQEMQPRPPQDETVSASVYGKEIGLRRPTFLVKLVEAGLTPGTEIVNSVTRRKQWCLKPEDITAFHERYTTPQLLGRDAGVHKRAVLSRLREAGVEPFAVKNLVFEDIYLRDDAENILKSV